MYAIVRQFSTRKEHKYALLAPENGVWHSQRRSHRARSSIMLATLLALFTAASVVTAWPRSHAWGHPPCNTIDAGYQCRPDLSHYWGQYSPYFKVESEIPDVLPEQCHITFVQILSRHGARDPTSSKTEVYNATISKIHANAQTYTGEFAFIEDYEYKLGADQLTSFGEQQMVDSGIKFYHRYESLAREFLPFFRSSGEERVVQSADNFTQGFHAAKLAGRCKDPAYPYPLVVIPEGDGINNVGFEASNLARTGCS